MKTALSTSNSESKKHIITEILFTLALTAILLFAATAVLERKVGKIKNEEFYKSGDDYDVLFFGSSHMVNGVFPVDLLKDQGISSYNLGAHNSYMATSYWLFRSAMDTAEPKLVVVDCYALRADYRWKRNALLHDILDPIPVGKTKIDALNDLFSEEEMSNVAHSEDDRATGKAEYVWDFIRYHSRWNDLSAEDIIYRSGEELGAESRVGVTPLKKKTYPNVDMKRDETLSEKYLKRIIKECREAGIDVLLIYLPVEGTEDDYVDAKRAAKIADEYDVGFINFLDMDIVDYATDFYDDESHLNPTGAHKVTHYLGEYISEHYY